MFRFASRALASLSSMALVCIVGCTSTTPRHVVRSHCEGLRPGRQIIQVDSEGAQRAVLVFAPAHLRERLPLVIDLHGSNGNGAEQANVSRLSELGARQRFIVANPSGASSLANSAERRFWNIPGVPLANAGAGSAGRPANDVRFISDLITQLVSQSCVDPRRVYVTGMSGGARMASFLACELSGQIAAVAPVAGLRAGLPDPDDASAPDTGSCQPHRPMPIISFHGTGDRVNPYQGGGTPYWQYSIPVALRRWVAINHCDGRPHETKVARHVTRISYRGCDDSAEIVLYRIDASGADGGGHSWPGARPPSSVSTGQAGAGAQSNLPSTEIDASALMWDFFKRHRRSQAPTPYTGGDIQ